MRSCVLGLSSSFLRTPHPSLVIHTPAPLVSCWGKRNYECMACLAPKGPRSQVPRWRISLLSPARCSPPHKGPILSQRLNPKKARSPDSEPESAILGRKVPHMVPVLRWQRPTEGLLRLWLGEGACPFAASHAKDRKKQVEPFFLAGLGSS